jgi:flagellar basal-body rod protein FlgC
MFTSIDTAGSGLATYQTWVDALANNIANVNDTAPLSGKAFQAEFVEAQAKPNGPDGVGTGVEAVGQLGSSAKGIVTHDPSDPNANAAGYVRRPDIDLSQQMGNLIMAQRALQANATVVSDSKQMYETAVNIGKGIQA